MPREGGAAHAPAAAPIVDLTPAQDDEGRAATGSSSHEATAACAWIQGQGGAADAPHRPRRRGDRREGLVDIGVGGYRHRRLLLTSTQARE